MAKSETVEIDLSEGDRETLINYYVMDHMSPESWETFMESCHDDIHNDKHYEVALADAIVNEMVNIALKELVDAEKDKFYFY